MEYAFKITKVDTVHLNVFFENTRAQKCYESVGFVARKTDMGAFSFKDESWDRCNMVIKKADFFNPVYNKEVIIMGFARVLKGSDGKPSGYRE